jgi:hypothetical protein
VYHTKHQPCTTTCNASITSTMHQYMYQTMHQKCTITCTINGVPQQSTNIERDLPHTCVSIYQVSYESIYFHMTHIVHDSTTQLSIILTHLSLHYSEEFFESIATHHQIIASQIDTTMPTGLLNCKSNTTNFAMNIFLPQYVLYESLHQKVYQ